MTTTEHFPERVEARPHGNRAHTRRKLSPIAYVQLGEDNGGILLNLGEGGFAVQSALGLTSREFPELRFQVPAVHGWLTAGGRIVWMSESMKEAGIQFTELPGEARREIQRWVSAEGEPDKTGERVPAPSKESPPKEILEAPHRGGGAAHEPMAHSVHVNGTQAEREREPAMQKQTVGVAAEPPPQDFPFTEYSMFTADPGKAGDWAEPARHRGRWRRAGLGVLVAVLFFALGAAVGREAVEMWIVDIGGWIHNQVTSPPKVTPPAPPGQAVAAGAAEANSEAKSATDENQTKAEDSVNPNSGSSADSELGKIPKEEKKNAETSKSKMETAKDGSAVESASKTGSAPRSGVAAGQPRRPTESIAPSDNREMEAASGRMAAEHSILVSAPEPGSPPFFVNLPAEAVSASGAIAISVRRTLEILPRGSAGLGRSERVVIGKLISHSEPFYPVEARNRHIEGNVELRARVGRTGQIISLTPVSGPQLLSSAAMTAIGEWRYEPTFIDGDPAETFAEITIVFRLP
jgi:TonB family protein